MWGQGGGGHCRLLWLLQSGPPGAAARRPVRHVGKRHSAHQGLFGCGRVPARGGRVARELGVSASALVDARGDQVERVFDVAVAPDGAVLVLDTPERCVRVFYPKVPEEKQS